MPHLDLSYLVENVTSDRAFINQLLEVFLGSLEGDIGELENAIEQNDHGRICRSAHKVKSSFRSLGMHAMTERLQEIENMGKDQNPLPDIRQNFDAFLGILPEVKSEVESYINSNVSP